MGAKKHKTQVDLLNGSIPKAMLAFAIPLLGSHVFQAMYNLIDTVVVGHVLGTTQLAGIGAATPIYSLLLGLCVGMGNGLAIVVGRSFGSGDEALLKRSVAGLIRIGLTVAVAITIVAQIIYRPMLRIMQTPDAVFGTAVDYISVITLAICITVIYNLCSGVLNAIGNSFMTMIFLIIANIVNIVLDILFVAGLNMGVRGAAIATIISQSISAIISLIYIFRNCKNIIPSKSDFAYDKEMYSDMIQQGLASALMTSIVALGTATFQAGINSLGEDIIAAHTTARKIYEFYIMPNMCFSQTLMAFCAQNKGAGKWDRVRACTKWSICFNVTVAAFITVLMAIFAPALITAVSGSSNPVIVSNGARYLRCVAPCVAILGSMNAFRMPLLSIGKKVIPVISSIVELVGKAIFVFAFIPVFGYNAVIAAEPVIWVAMLATLVVFYLHIPELNPKKYGAVKS